MKASINISIINMCGLLRWYLESETMFIPQRDKFLVPFESTKTDLLLWWRPRLFFVSSRDATKMLWCFCFVFLSTKIYAVSTRSDSNSWSAFLHRPDMPHTTGWILIYCYDFMLMHYHCDARKKVGCLTFKHIQLCTRNQPLLRLL